MSEIPADRPITVIIQQPSRPGFTVGLFGCAFGILGIFTFGFIFAPLGLLCAIIGFSLGLFGRSGAGEGVSILAALLSIVAALKSPVLLLLLGVGVLASAPHQPTADHAAVGSLNPTVQAQPLSGNSAIASSAQPIGIPTFDKAAQLNQAVQWNMRCRQLITWAPLV
jgi:hypothetical protein